ncbi:hypothetical protein K8Z61_05460 [Nocardioides sp. TRM66260-LWL]|uniref:hypothetical protein n=1 Tax=Nocardioides sp. TRM66260-LWL TaxID=2874478 RepID=UPI001CC4CEA1|nr:hypothetical protein [Nocardioides sp. TRM66260-LWL]MBZ5733937.1 hypothetical protein [Nocardioides sp. TRM66260-LWL]
MVAKRTQTIVLTAVPRGWSEGGSTVRIGVHVSPRLSYSGTGATLADFPAWLDWPAQSLAWEVSWDAGRTWAAADDVVDAGDSAFWTAILRPQVPVVSFDGTPPPAGKVRGYSYAALEKTVLAALDGATLGATAAGRAAITAAAVRTPEPDRSPTASPTAALTAFRGFHRPRRAAGGVPGRGSLDDDLHARLALLGDHGPLLERLGLVVELVARPPAKASSATVRARWTPGGGVTTRVRRTRTACTLTASVFRARAASDSLLDAGLRYRVDGPEFTVHSLDADVSAAQLLGAAAGPEGKADAPPAGRSSGLTLALVGRAARVSAQIARARAVAADVVAGEVPLLYADDLAIGTHVQVSPTDSGAWFGLGHRRVRYRAEGAARGLAFEAVDEAAVTIAARREQPGSPDLLVSDVLARFDGWSVAVPRPGGQMIQTPQGSRPDARPERPALTWLTMDASVPAVAADGADGRLPSLRYGRSYALRARAVDLTGRGMGPWTGAPATAPAPYLRWDPVPAPLVLAPPSLTAGESARRMVVRSDPASGLGPRTPSVRTLVPPRVAAEIGLLHGVFDAEDSHAPDSLAWQRIADLDARTPPTDAPPPDLGAPAGTGGAAPVPTTGSPGPTDGGVKGAPDAQPHPLPVDWLPDPMATGVVVDPDAAPATPARFLPPGASPSGRAEIGAWNAVGLRLRAAPATPTPAGPVTVDALGGDEHQQVVSLALAPGEVRTVRLRAQPTPDLLSHHGVVSRLGGTAEQRAATVAAGGAPLLTPSVEVEIVHAVRAPLEAPAIGSAKAARVLGRKDAPMTTRLRCHRTTTGRLTLRASWSQWRDDGPGTPAPRRVQVQRHVVLDRSLDPGASTGVTTQLDLAPTFVLPDARRITASLEAVATSRFVDEWREPIPALAAQRSDGGTYLVLPDDVDVESVRLVRGGATVAATDLEGAFDPDTGRPTLRLLGDLPAAVAAGQVDARAVRGEVLRVSAPYQLALRSAVRPAPPQPRYAVPSFRVEPGTADGAGATAARRGTGLRLWLERPWWSSGDGEQLAVVTEVSKTPLGTEDRTRLERLVTTYGADPTLRAGDPVPRTGALVSGTEVDRLPISEELGASLKAGSTFTARMHDVAYDAERDAYWVDLAFADLPAGTFVRLAIARYQPLMAAAPGASLATAVGLSRIVTLDPVLLLPERRATVRRDGTTVTARVEGRVHRGASEGARPFLRVSLQQKVGGGPDTGWRTVAAATGVATDAGYPPVALDAPAGRRPQRLLVEELERWRAGGPDGTLAPPAAATAPTGDPDDRAGTVAGLTGVRPVWVATLPLPAG